MNSEGLNDLVEMQLLAMKTFLLKLKCKALQDAEESTSSSGNGRIVVSRKKVHCHEFPLAEKNVKVLLESRKLRNTLVVTESNANQEWQHIFAGANVEGHAAIVTNPGCDVATVTPIVGLGGSPASAVVVGQTSNVCAATSLGEYTMPDRNFWQGMFTIM